MLRYILYIIIVLQLCKLSSQQFKQPVYKELPYVAAVVQYHPVILNEDKNDLLPEENAKNYAKIMDKARSYNADIVVFPELALMNLFSNKSFAQPFKAALVDPKINNNINYVVESNGKRPYTSRYAATYRGYLDFFAKHATPLISAQAKVRPCAQPRKYPNVLEILSCAARRNKLYAVVHLTERTDCGSRCQDVELFSTNVVFDREGSIVATYRKSVPYDEPWVRTTKLRGSMPFFDTDFGITFGLVNGADIMAEGVLPRLVSTKRIHSVIMTTHRNDAVPFLTLESDHSYWAETNNIDLLVAGGSRDSSGGIYLSGQVNFRSDFKASANAMLVVKVLEPSPRVPVHKRHFGRIESHTFPKSEISTFSFAPPYSGLAADIWRLEELANADESTFVSLLMPADQQQVKKLLCTSGRSICCEFDIKVHFNQSLVDQNRQAKYYRYRLIAFRAVYLLDSNVYHAAEVCAVVSCTSTKPADCGKAFHQNDTVIHPREFEQLTVHRRYNKMKNSFSAPLVTRSDGVSHNYNFRSFKSGPSLMHYLMLSSRSNTSRLMIFGINTRSLNVDMPEFLLRRRPELTPPPPAQPKPMVSRMAHTVRKRTPVDSTNGSVAARAEGPAGQDYRPAAPMKPQWSLDEHVTATRKRYRLPIGLKNVRILKLGKVTKAEKLIGVEEVSIANMDEAAVTEKQVVTEQQTATEQRRVMKKQEATEQQAVTDEDVLVGMEDWETQELEPGLWMPGDTMTEAMEQMATPTKRNIPKAKQSTAASHETTTKAKQSTTDDYGSGPTEQQTTSDCDKASTGGSEPPTGTEVPQEKVTPKISYTLFTTHSFYEFWPLIATIGIMFVIVVTIKVGGYLVTTGLVQRAEHHLNVHYRAEREAFIAARNNENVANDNALNNEEQR